MDDQSDNISDQEQDHLAGATQEALEGSQGANPSEGEPEKDPIEELPAFAKKIDLADRKNGTKKEIT